MSTLSLQKIHQNPSSSSGEEVKNMKILRTTDGRMTDGALWPLLTWAFGSGELKLYWTFSKHMNKKGRHRHVQNDPCIRVKNSVEIFKSTGNGTYSTSPINGYHGNQEYYNFNIFNSSSSWNLCNIEQYSNILSKQKISLTFHTQ